MNQAAKEQGSEQAFSQVDRLAINSIRTLSMDAVQKANSGHPGLPMGAAPMAYVLWQRHLKHNPSDPGWPDRDRFVLSAGHGCMLTYSLLHLTGYDLSMDDLKDFRQWGSKTPGHPEASLTPGIEATTGPLGQGTANAAGMAIAERFLAKQFNRPGHNIVDHFTYALVSDGDLMEGLSMEVASLAGHLKLGKLIYLYDANDISLDGPLSMTFSEDVAKRYEAQGWQVLRVEDGDTDLEAIDAAISAARAQTQKPSIIIVHTTIGFGSPNRSGKSAAHGMPLGDDEIALTKKQLGWPETESFVVPADALAQLRTAVARGASAQKDWQHRFDGLQKSEPDLALAWQTAMAGQLPEGWETELPRFAAGQSVATRAASGQALNAIAAHVPWLVGTDADLSSSTKAHIKDGGSFEGQTGSGRNIHCGVREHAMGSIANGMAYHGGVRVFTSTFFCFSDYMRPSVRLAALNNLPIVYVWTHDSIALGEDGPTHQPVEHVMSLRAMPNLAVMRPCDAAETVEAWRFAMQQKDLPVALVLSRQNLPTLDRDSMAAATELARGAYVLSEAAGRIPQAILLATGSEVHVALEAQTALAKDGVAARVVSMPCWELFAKQDAAYRESVLPANVTARVSIEAGVTFGWDRWTGDRGVSIGVDRFGASAPASVLLEKFGLTAKHVVDAVHKLLA